MSGARSNGVNVTSAPDTGHFSYLIPSVSLEELLSDKDVCSPKKLSDEARDMTVGVVVPVVVVRHCHFSDDEPLSSDEIRAARISGASDSHILATSFGIDAVDVDFIIHCSLHCE